MHVFIYLLLSKEMRKRTEAVDNDDDDDDSIFWLMMRPNQFTNRQKKRKGWRGRKILYYLIIIRISFIPFHFLHFTWRWCWILITIAWANEQFWEMIKNFYFVFWKLVLFLRLFTNYFVDQWFIYEMNPIDKSIFHQQQSLSG